MKKSFRFVGFGGLLTALLAVGAVASFAQDPCTDVDGINNLYTEVTTKYNSKDLTVKQQAVDAAKQFLEKYGACEPAKAQADWMKPKVPAWEKQIADAKAAAATGALYNRFDAGFKASNWDEVYASGKDILSKEPEKLDVILVLATVGVDQSAKKNTKYNDDTITYAKLALQKLDAGAKSDSGKYGLFNITYGDAENAKGWMNMNIGYLLFDPKNDRKGGLPYLYRATQTGRETKEYAYPYEYIGRYFLGESTKLRDELKAMVGKPVDPNATPEQKAAADAEYKAKESLYYGTLDRSLEGYTRAYKYAKSTDKTYKDSMYQRVKDIYNVRFQKDTGVDDYIAATVAKPLTDPATAVAPVEGPAEVKSDTTKTSSSPAPATPTKPGETSGVTKSTVAKKANR